MNCRKLRGNMEIITEFKEINDKGLDGIDKFLTVKAKINDIKYKILNKARKELMVTFLLDDGTGICEVYCFEPYAEMILGINGEDMFKLEMEDKNAIKMKLNKIINYKSFNYFRLNIRKWSVWGVLENKLFVTDFQYETEELEIGTSEMKI